MIMMLSFLSCTVILQVTWYDFILLASLWNLLSNSGLSCCTMNTKPKPAKSATYWQWRFLLYTCMDLAEFAQLCLHYNQLWRNSEENKGSQSFAATPLALFIYSSHDDRTKHTFTNLAVFALESSPKSAPMVCSKKNFIHVGNDLCHSFGNGNPRGFAGLGRTPSKASWAWWAGKREHLIRKWRKQIEKYWSVNNQARLEEEWRLHVHV